MLELKKHKFNFFPEIISEDFEMLKQSISEGFNPKLGKIILFDGDVLDGWNRYRACKETGTEPLFETFTGTEQEAFELSIKANQDRRHLTKSQLACVAIDAEPIWKVIQENVEKERKRKIAEARAKQEAEKKERERLEVERKMQAIRRENERIEREKLADAAEKKRIAEEREKERIAELKRVEKEKREKEKAQLIAPSDKYEKETRTKLATTFGTNRQYISDAKKLKEENPEAFEAVKNGNKTITETKKEIKKAIRLEKIEEIKTEISKGLKAPNGLYDVIAIDPPWEYSERGGSSSKSFDDNGNRGGVDYPTMTIDELKKMNIPCKDDSVIYLWTTHAFLRDSFDLLDAWGYTYKATIVWDKVSMGMGRNMRMQVEFCLLGIKGKPILNGSGERDIITEARRQHSRKPEAFYKKVENMTAGYKLDYFAREKRDGWFTYGAEDGKF